VHSGDEESVPDFGGKSEGKRPLGRPRHNRMWEKNVNMDLRERERMR
jgi:hypothetical protein